MAKDTSKGNKGKSLSSAYLELHRFGQNGEFDRAIKTANKILQQSPQEEKALHCKIVCLIQQSKFQDALQIMQKNQSLSKDLYFEKAYCQYRLNNTTHALETIKQVEEPDLHLKELKAQILYRSERFEEAFEIYQDIIKNSDDDYADERETNLGAVIVQLNYTEPSKKEMGLRSNTYELCYNLACFLITLEDYVEAEKKLKMCEKLYRESLEDDGLLDEEIQVELAFMWIQLAYVYHKQGRIKESHQMYTSALKLKLDDPALVAVASNNIVVINKDQNIFDSKKKMKAATNEALLYKLPAFQRQYITLNNAIFMYYSNQLQHCIKLCKLIEEKWPILKLQARITHALSLSKLENINKAFTLLNNYSPKDKEEKLYIKLAYVHLLLMQNQKLDACKIMENMGEDTYKPAIVGALITLYLGMDKRDTALSIFEKAVLWYRENKQVNDVNLSNMWRQAADFHMYHDQPNLAASSLQELIRNNPNDMKAIAQLALVYLQFDKEEATKIANTLPPVNNILSETDLEALENLNVFNVKRTVNKLEYSPGTPKTELIEEKRKKTHKRKGKLPKNCDPNKTPDPERWLPKYERIGFRKKRDRRNKEIIKGSQGATATTETEQFDFTKVPEQDSQNSPPLSVEPSPQPGGQQKRQQKKKIKRR